MVVQTTTAIYAAIAIADCTPTAVATTVCNLKLILPQNVMMVNTFLLSIKFGIVSNAFAA